MNTFEKKKKWKMWTHLMPSYCDPTWNAENWKEQKRSSFQLSAFMDVQWYSNYLVMSNMRPSHAVRGPLGRQWSPQVSPLVSLHPTFATLGAEFIVTDLAWCGVTGLSTMHWLLTWWSWPLKWMFIFEIWNWNFDM